MSNFNDVVKHLEEHEISFRIPMLSNKDAEIEFRPMKVRDQKALVVNASDESYLNQLKSLDNFKNNILSMSDDLKIYMTFPKVKHLINSKEDGLLLDLLVHEIDYIEFKNEVIDLKDSDRSKLLNGMNSKDIEAFKTFEESNEFGSILKFTFNCVSCKKDNTVEIKENLLSFF